MPQPGLAESGSLPIQISWIEGGTLPDRNHLYGAQNRVIKEARRYRRRPRDLRESQLRQMALRF
jgi:hypothetical protein